MQFEKDLIERKQSELHAKYGIHIDSSIVVMILLMQDELKKESELLHVAAEKINNSQKTFQAQNSAQAFWHGFGLWGLSSVFFLILAVSTFLFVSSQNQELKAYRSLGIKIDKVGSTYFCTIPLGTADSNTRVVGIIPYKNENDRISVTENQNIIFVRGIPESSLK